MVEPVAFGFNEETAANNYFQQRTVAAGETVQACALKEFRGMVDKLRKTGGYLAADRVGGVQHPSEGRLYRF